MKKLLIALLIISSCNTKKALDMIGDKALSNVL